ncbi:hypothetical protein [Nocardia thailandica]|uniref:hypothetical protein n=1 Tax=Nocardia thailandica TaxID=257275 RepID=UPI0002F11353|nr:hypothetical protein [Nocardia thailandica]
MSDDETGPRTTAAMIASWPVPEGAPQAEMIKQNLIAAFAALDDDPQLVADLAVGQLVLALGNLEVELAQARHRIEALERALGRPARPARG